MRNYSFHGHINCLVRNLSLLFILITPYLVNAQTTIDDIVKDHKFEKIDEHIYSVRSTPIKVTLRRGPQSRGLIAPQYHQYWIDYYNTKNVKKLPKELHKHLNISDEVLKNLEKAIKDCDKKAYDSEMSRIKNSIYYLNKYKNVASKDLSKINNSYNERVKIFQELIGVNWKYHGTTKTASAAWKINSVYEGTKNLATKNPLLAIIGTIWNTVTLGIEIDNYFVAKRYLVGALAVFKLKVLYERFVFHFFDTELNKYRGLQGRFSRYNAYFISKGNCAKQIIVVKKQVNKLKSRHDAWEFVWHLKDNKGKPIKLGTLVKIRRTVEYKLKLVGNSPNTFNRNESVRIGSDGILKIVWEKTDPRQKKVTYSIRDVIIPKFIYEGKGDPLTKQVDENTKVGQLKMKAFDKDKSQVGFHVGIYENEKYINSVAGDGLVTYDLPEGNYQLKFYIGEESIFKENVSITNDESTLIEVSLSDSNSHEANDTYGQLNIKVYDEEDIETTYFVRINHLDGTYIKSIDGKDLTEKLPPMHYNLKFSIDGKDVERHVEVKEGETTHVEIRLADESEVRSGTYVNTSKEIYATTEDIEVDFGVELKSSLKNRQWDVVIAKESSGMQNWLFMGGMYTGDTSGNVNFSELGPGKYEARLLLLVPPSNADGLMFESILVKTSFEVVGEHTDDEKIENNMPVPVGWAKGTLYNSNDGSCSLEDKYLIFMNAVRGKFKNLRTGEVNQYMIVAPGNNLEVAAPANSAFIRVFISSSSSDVNAMEGGSISHGTISQLVDGWWYQAGCKNGTRPTTSCDNGKGQGAGSHYSCRTLGE